MHRRRYIIITIFLFGVLLLIGAYGYNRYLTKERQQRESHFIAIHFLAEERLIEGSSEEPKNLEDLMRPYGNAVLMKHFPDGLIYHPNQKSFTLEEPNKRRISLFRSDRLVATDRRWPRWEVSGEYAKKMRNQKVPPQGYE
jgi:hypothetical protein